MANISIRRLSIIGAATGLVACADPPPGDTYFEHYIQPVLVQNCANNVSGCHRIVEGDPLGRAAGNLDVTTFERINKRRDLLSSFGAYSYPALLIKAVAPSFITPVAADSLPLNYNGEQLDLEIAHSGQGVFRVDSDAFGLLLEWLDNGATETGLKPPTPARLGDGPCSTAIPTSFDAAAAMAEGGGAWYSEFAEKVQPIFDRLGCASANCHGAPQADFYITCGSTDLERAFNYAQSRAFVADPPEQSQLLSVPLAREAGGLGHAGGDQLASRSAQDYLDIRTWAANTGPLVFGTPGSPEAFFAEHVQPIFLQRGCSFMNCHSPAAPNDFKLRPGSQGFFSPLALQKNYDQTKHEFMALEFPDARLGRVVSKNLLPDAGGVRHRAGPALEIPTRNVADVACPPFDPANAEASFQAGIPASPAGQTQFSPFCTIQAWLTLERDRLPAGTVLPFTPGTGTADIIYVDRPNGASGDLPTEFSNYHPGSELRIATFGLDAAGHLAAVQTDVPLLPAGACAAATYGGAGNADIRGPEVNIDGDLVAFSMRTGDGEGLQVWTYRRSTGLCARVTSPVTGPNGIIVDNFDPVWSPDGEWIVFASTRGATGPTRSRSPGFQPQSDLWRMRPDGTAPEQITFLSNSELGPAFMRDGRITMTTEKIYVDPDAKLGGGVIHQLSGRRINWDRTDYHPLLTQRARSPYADPGDLDQTSPSIGFTQATDIRERANGDFLFILSDDGANGGGGALAILSRSVGPFEAGRRGDDNTYLESLTLVTPPGDTDLGRLAATTAYRGAVGLHDGQILTSYATLSGTLDAATDIAWQLHSVDVDPNTGAATQRRLITRPGAQLDAIEVVKRPVGALYVNRRQLVFGGSTNASHPTTAYLHVPDAPMIFTMLTGNLRRGRPVDAFRAATHIEFWSEDPNPGSTANTMGIFQSRQLLGRVALQEDHSTRVELPSGRGVVMKLVDASGGVIVSMGEEHQLAPGEEITMGIKQGLFDAACGGCHGSVSGSELDVATNPDVLTGASASLAQTTVPLQLE